MMTHDDGPRRPETRLPRGRTRVPLRRLCFSLLLALLLGTTMISGWPSAVASAHAATLAPPTPATHTLAQFLATQQAGKGNHGPFHFPSQVPAALPNSATTPPAPLPSVEPPKMQPLTLALDSSQVAMSAPGMVIARPTGAAKALSSGPLTLSGSDGRLQVQVPPKDFDLSAAARLDGLAPVGALRLQLSQLH